MAAAGRACVNPRLLPIGKPYTDNDFLTWTTAAGPSELLPINCVNWYEAFAFCAWDGGRLPTEAEWEYAARGGAREWKYPWGDEEPIEGQVTESRRPDLKPVGSAPSGSGGFGQRDLLGSVWEWTLDSAASDYPPTCGDCANLDRGPPCNPALPASCENCATMRACPDGVASGRFRQGLSAELEGLMRVIRGFGPSNLRLGWDPEVRDMMGVRCARRGPIAE